MNMAIRLLAMKRVLKETGSIYLHCDPTASHYLKLVMDVIFGKKNFRNEIIWSYRTGGVGKRWFGRKHDVILFYVKSEKAEYTFNVLKERSYNRGYKPYRFKEVEEFEDENGHWYTMASMRDVWEINAIGRTSKERLGYDTQKPLELLNRIIKASCPPDGVVLDPFCGCGTTVHAAENLKRSWIGIDISKFSTELIRGRILKEFPLTTSDEIEIIGTPESASDAYELAQQDKHEFEKWVCGRIGAQGLYHDPGTRGADGGVDGELVFYPIRGNNDRAIKEHAIVQVKGGHVTPDSVRALRERVDHFGVTAGVMVCFEQYMGTVNNQRSRDMFSDNFGSYPVIQGLSIENLIAGEMPNLPLYGARRQGGRLNLF